LERSRSEEDEDEDEDVDLESSRSEENVWNMLRDGENLLELFSLTTYDFLTLFLSDRPALTRDILRRGTAKSQSDVWDRVAKEHRELTGNGSPDSFYHDGDFVKDRRDVPWSYNYKDRSSFSSLTFTSKRDDPDSHTVPDEIHAALTGKFVYCSREEGADEELHKELHKELFRVVDKSDLELVEAMGYRRKGRRALFKKLPATRDVTTFIENRAQALELKKAQLERLLQLAAEMGDVLTLGDDDQSRTQPNSPE
jgi:hypothetical protein